jgi:ribonuclease-3 family protein
MNYNTLNVLSLAYIGDAIYEVYIRKHLIQKGIVKVEQLQKEAVNYVSAKNQAYFLKNMIDNNVFTENEMQIIIRARNHKGNRHPKNTDIITYKHSTGLEAIIGYLYLNNNIERINYIMNYILEVK